MIVKPMASCTVCFVSMVQDFAKKAIVAVLILSLPLLDMTAITWTLLLLSEAVSHSYLRGKL